MTREENLDAMCALNQRAACLPNNADEMINIRAAWYLHRIIEAVLSENIESLPTASNDD